MKLYGTVCAHLVSARFEPTLMSTMGVPFSGLRLRQPEWKDQFLENVKPVVAQLREKFIATTRRGSRGARAQPPAPTTEAERVRVSRRWWERTTLPR